MKERNVKIDENNNNKYSKKEKEKDIEIVLKYLKRNSKIFS